MQLLAKKKKNSSKVNWSLWEAGSEIICQTAKERWSKGRPRISGHNKIKKTNTAIMQKIPISSDPFIFCLVMLLPTFLEYNNYKAKHIITKKKKKTKSIEVGAFKISITLSYSNFMLVVQFYYGFISCFSWLLHTGFGRNPQFFSSSNFKAF